MHCASMDIIIRTLCFPMAFISPNKFLILITTVIFVILSTNPFPCLSLISRCHPQESHALLLFKAAFNDSHGSLNSWVNGTDCCTMWKGVSCYNHTNHVLQLQVTGMQGGVISNSIQKLPYLQYLVLPGNMLSGYIPPTICNLTSLAHLLLDDNQLTGNIPTCLGNLTSLNMLDLSHNQLIGQIPDCFGNLSALEHIDISFNLLSGTLPSSFSSLSSLHNFSAHGNRFNESIHFSTLPPSLSILYLSFDHHVKISETVFLNLTRLTYLYLSNCVLNISPKWIPSFQLQSLYLISCNIGGQIPPWISTQFFLKSLFLGNNSLVGEIPSWLWDTSPFLIYVNISINHLQGKLNFANTSSWMQLYYLDLSGNALSGPMPSTWSPYLKGVFLNDNLFTDSIPPSLGSLSWLQFLNLANNKLNGSIPSSLANCSALEALNLENNNLDGRIPHELSQLSLLYSLVLESNKLTGSFPESLTKCSKLQVLNIGHNSIKGQVPKSIANLSELRVLVMKGNDFTGDIPSEIGQLMNLQILDLSCNHISGFIPQSLLDLQEMVRPSNVGFILSDPNVTGCYYYEEYEYRDGLDMTSKGTDLHYSYILSTLTVIDLSKNQLQGELTPDFGKLKGLRQLNLSMNNLSGAIPGSLREMILLDSLDLSSNGFSGKIPSDLESLSYLGSLKLSNNNLSGGIPQGGKINSFPNSSFLGNPNLWGCPLPKNCNWPEFASPPPTPKKEEENKKNSWYGIAVGLSYGAGFAGIASLLIIGVRWRQKYFEKVDLILKFLFPLPWLNNCTL